MTDGYTIPETAPLVTGYEYGVQGNWDGEWFMVHTNHFHGWYPSEKSAKNALAQLRAVRYGYRVNRDYRLVRRPYGEVEVIG
jgi:hypothetical protein